MTTTKIVVTLSDGTIVFAIDKETYDTNQEIRAQAQDTIEKIRYFFPKAAVARWEIDDLLEVTHTEPYSF